MSEQEDDPLAALLKAGLETRTYTPPTPTTDREFEEISEQEYESWLTPQAMIDAMPYGIANYEQLGRELGADRFWSAADEVIWIHEGRTGRDKFAKLGSWVWRSSMPQIDSTFWRTGYLEAVLSKPGIYDISARSSIEIYGVRFWSPALAAKAVLPDATELAATPKPNVARGDLERWHQIFVQVHPGASEALALQSAAAMFPDKAVPRQWVRDLRGPQPLGKPKTRHE